MRNLVSGKWYSVAVPANTDGLLIQASSPATARILKTVLSDNCPPRLLAVIFMREQGIKRLMLNGGMVRMRLKAMTVLRSWVVWKYLMEYMEKLGL
jgi:hypothetical protein